LVEAAGIEPASEAVSSEISTSVSGNLISPLGSSRRDPSRPAAVSVPVRSRRASGPASRLLWHRLPGRPAPPGAVPGI